MTGPSWRRSHFHWHLWRKQLRDRYLELMLDGQSDTSAEPLPGPAPTWAELNERWVG
jgi:hypothetical protein